MNKIGTFTVTASIVSLLLTPVAFAEQGRGLQKDAGVPQTQEQTSSSPEEKDQGTLKPVAPTGLTAQQVPGGKTPLFKASKLIGYGVKNKKGEEIGEIEELVINSQDGRIAYAVLSFGGFLGMGDKLFAIPWKSLTPIPEQHSFSLDIDKEKLAEAPGFDETNWPDAVPQE